MDFEKICFESNDVLLNNFAGQMGTTDVKLYEMLKLVARYPQLYTMANQIHGALKQNPNAVVNFGEYGAKVANDLGLDQEHMYQSLIASSCHELLLNITTQLNNFYNK